MIYLLVLISFIFISTIITFIYSIIKISEQNKIKKKRIEILKIQTNNNIIKTNLSQSLYELYIETFSHYITYMVGHFSSILLDIYSVIFSIVSLSMISLDITDDATRIISLLSTFFIIILVFSKLTERSKRHFFAWKKCENTIAQIFQLLDADEDSKNDEQIFSLISTYVKDK